MKPAKKTKRKPSVSKPAEASTIAGRQLRQEKPGDKRARQTKPGPIKK